jgi:hypothetical protein
MFWWLVSIIIILIIIIYLMSKEGFTISPEIILGAKDILKRPNSFEQFKQHVCNGTSHDCVDAIDYMDARDLIRQDNFTLSALTRLQK